MPLPPVDRKQVEELLSRAAEQLAGEWVLVGGALALIWLGGTRATEDVDLFPIRPAAGDRLALMDLAAGVGLPIEAVNSAADYFVRKVAGWEQMLEVLRKGPRATIYRPNPTLFVLLKIQRLSESDLGDCLLLLQRCPGEGFPLDIERIRREVAALPPADDPDLRDRRANLLRSLPRT